MVNPKKLETGLRTISAGIAPFFYSSGLTLFWVSLALAPTLIFRELLGN